MISSSGASLRSMQMSTVSDTSSQHYLMALKQARVSCRKYTILFWILTHNLNTTKESISRSTMANDLG